MTPAPYWTDGTVTLYVDDCREMLLGLSDASVDAIVTDPPYELGFMGRTWDASGIAYDPAMWAECLRVLKPGGHMVAFGGTRTYHRMVCAIEDAGFEIRDSMHWITGQGFPKSLNVNKDARFCQCDLGELPNGDRELCGVRQAVPDVSRLAQTSEVPDLFASMQREGSRPGLGESWPQGRGSAEDDAHTQVRSRQSSLEGGRDLQAAEGELHRPEVRPLSAGTHGNGQVGRLHHGTPAGHGPVDWPCASPDGGREPHRPQPPEQRPVEPGAVSVERGPQARRGWPVCGGCGKPSIPPGLGTALRPAHEPIVLARRPLRGTVAATVLAHGTGALNIDACRIGWDPASLAKDTARRQQPRHDMTGGRLLGGASGGYQGDSTSPAGRWPTNVVLSHPPTLADPGQPIGDACADGCVQWCPVAELDRQSGVTKSSGGKGEASRRTKSKDVYSAYANEGTWSSAGGLGDSGGASRFFPVFRYEAKAPSSERPRLADGTAHATVKPLALMRWLVRLVTPPGGLVLDPFAGSGTTGEACVIEGFRSLLIEQDPAHAELIKVRLDKPLQPALDFGEPA